MNATRYLVRRLLRSSKQGLIDAEMAVTDTNNLLHLLRLSSPDRWNDLVAIQRREGFLATQSYRADSIKLSFQCGAIEVIP